MPCGTPATTPHSLDILPVLDALSGSGARHIVSYVVAPAVLDIFGERQTLELVADAWQAWIMTANGFVVRRVGTIAEANVVIRLGPIDGPGGTLGMAHIGGPHVHARLECTMDERELWTPRRFAGALCHELGHILGLTHSDTPGQLMNPVMHADITVPQAEDASRLRQLWK